MLPAPGKNQVRESDPFPREEGAALRVLSGASSPPQAEVLLLCLHVKAALPVVSNSASLLYLRKGQEEFQGFFLAR